MYNFYVGDRVVYPSHGVGEIIGEEIEQIAGVEIKVYIISLYRDKLTLRVPVKRAARTGLRPLCSLEKFRVVFDVFKLKANSTKGMWSKRAQEYELKINSGDVRSLAEVARDLHKNSDHPERSYSERVIYESALNRLATEYAMLKGIEVEKALDKITSSLEEVVIAA